MKGSRRGMFSALQVLAVLAGILMPAHVRGNLRIPPSLSPEQYGDVLMNRSSERSGMAPVVFSHWSHRTRYTCTVCHQDLEFSFKAGDTAIDCGQAGKTGTHCAACHNGRIAFGTGAAQTGGECSACHNAGQEPARDAFDALRRSLPPGESGNGIDWAAAVRNGLVRPKRSLTGEARAIVLDRTLTISAEMAGIPPAVFPHRSHEEWLNCSICHPELFNIKKKGTYNFTMSRILGGEFCGVCHVTVAFPLDACRRCHPSMKRARGR